MLIMMYRDIPHFIIKNPMNKTRATGKVFADDVTVSVLQEVCSRITGQNKFTHDYVGNDYQDEFIPRSYNRGRTAIMQYHDEVFYITFSEKEAKGRNSSVQSVPTAYNMFYINPHPKKKMYYYFLSNPKGIRTPYQRFIYRLFATVGITFLNDEEVIGYEIHPFNSIEDVIYNRKDNTRKNKSNNPTYVTKSSSKIVEVYGKTFGANKYETSLLCYALSSLCQDGQVVKLYQVAEGDLVVLPASSLRVLREMGNIELIRTDMRMECKQFEENNSLRSPRYTYNLLNKLGKKHCALCRCEIPELIQGAHIWPVADIKRTPALTPEQRLEYALDGENGLWLCENHHKLFDEGMLTFDLSGNMILNPEMESGHQEFINEITKFRKLPQKFVTGKFGWYLEQRLKVDSAG